MSNPNAFPSPQLFPLLKLNDRLYDVLKWVAQVGLPSVTTAYFLLGQLWVWPMIIQVVGTLTVVDAVLGIWLGVSTAAYKKLSADGVFSIGPDPDNPDAAVFQMKVDGDARALVGKRYLTLRAK